MNRDLVECRGAIEALRSGVPTRHVVERLGTTHQSAETAFRESLGRIAAGELGSAVGFKAGFGQGKTHLLTHLQNLAERDGFVTSRVVVSPETPLGNAVEVLREIARNALAPGLNGDALRELSTSARTDTREWARLREWAANADIEDRFRAMLLLYEEYRADVEFQVRLLEDIGGKPLFKSEITKRLRAIGQGAAYDLKGGPRNALLAHDRILVYARLANAFGAKGLVLLFDEVERVANYTFKQRLAAYAELAWWHRIAQCPGTAILPLFVVTQGALDTVLTQDAGKLATSGDIFGDPSDDPHRAGLDFLRSTDFKPLSDPTSEQLQSLRYKVEDVYKQAYAINGLPDVPERTAPGSLRQEIRRWITYWDMARIYPGYAPDVTAGEVEHDTREIDDSVLPSEAHAVEDS